MFIRIFLLFFYTAGALAITCYVHSGDGDYRIVTKPYWTECIIMPRGTKDNTRTAGMNATVNTEAMKGLLPGAPRKINWQCIQDTLDYSGHPAYKDSSPVHMFTCSCYTDLCNTLENLKEHMKMANAAI